MNEHSPCYGLKIFITVCYVLQLIPFALLNASHLAPTAQSNPFYNEGIYCSILFPVALNAVFIAAVWRRSQMAQFITSLFNFCIGLLTTAMGVTMCRDFLRDVNNGFKPKENGTLVAMLPIAGVLLLLNAVLVMQLRYKLKKAGAFQVPPENSETP